VYLRVGERIGGGVIVYLRNELIADRIELQNNELDLIELKVKYKK
jgi:hypothetical protein